MSSIGVHSVTSRNPNPGLRRPAASMALCRAPPASLGFEALRRPQTPHCKLSIPTLTGINFRLRSVRNRPVSSLPTSNEESKASDFDKEREDLKVGAEESQEAWQQALEAFKQQALNMQSISKEAYELYSEKAIVTLRETSENLKIQAEKARQDLSVVAKEIAEGSKEYLATAAEDSPEQVKDIVETFASADELNDVSKVRDFYVGIPYGGLLSVGGFVSFMLTGSIPAIRFGIILGGALLALSISSLRSWKKGEFSPLVLKGQTAISTILFLRELRLFSTRPFIVNFISLLVSGGVVAFYLYRLVRDGEPRGSSPELGQEN